MILTIVIETVKQEVTTILIKGVAVMILMMKQ